MKKRKRFSTGFLYATPSFITGAGTVLNLAGNYYEYNISDTELQADFRALANDFGVVGNDLRDAMDELARECEASQNPAIVKTSLIANDESTPDQVSGASKSVAKIEERLLKENPNLFQGMKKDQRQQLIRTLVLTLHKTHIGPLPDVETLEGYANLIPNGADRVMQMAERQANHRMTMEAKHLDGSIAQSNRGQWMGFFVAIFGLSLSGLLAYFDHEILASSIATVTIVGLVTVFVLGKRAQRKELDQNK